MNTLIVEDDFTSRLLLQELLRGFGSSQVATTGQQAVMAVSLALQNNAPYDLICLDIMMPEMDGQQALKEIRTIEERYGRRPGQGAKILMTTQLNDKDVVMQSFRDQCDGYLVKPIDKARLIDYLCQFALI
jgi:two-component system, chemotaxis family, chemotaxis protein CheY